MNGGAMCGRRGQVHTGQVPVPLQPVRTHRVSCQSRDAPEWAAGILASEGIARAWRVPVSIKAGRAERVDTFGA